VTVAFRPTLPNATLVWWNVTSIDAHEFRTFVFPEKKFLIGITTYQNQPVQAPS